MKSRLILFGLIVTLSLLGAASPGKAQSPSTSADAVDPDQENTRGAFLTSRPKTVEKSTKTTATPSPQPRRSRRRPATTTTSSTSGPAATSGTTTSGTSAVNNEGNPSKKKAIVQKMGLGLTLFMSDSNGLAVRVDPTHEFHKGDRVRVLLETNSDGHLYIFNTTDDGPPVMVYPDAHLDEAGNYLKAHVPLEVPSSVAPEEGLRWFRFDEHVGKERLYFVFTREPLTGVPIEDDLVKLCGEGKTQCAWQPSSEMWAGLQKQLSVPSAAVAKVQSDGKAQTATEHQAATRGIGLSRDDPEPSLVMMNASSDSGLLVTALALVHQ